MHLLIENYGVKMEVEDDKFKLSSGEEVRYASPVKLSSINFMKPCTVTTPALLLAVAHQVPVLFYGKNGKVQAWVGSHQFGSIADIRINQAFFSRSHGAVNWAAELIGLKIDGQVANLQWLAHRIVAQRPQLQKALDAIKKIRQNSTQLSIEDIRNLEAQASRCYWEALAFALEKYIIIPGRVKKGAADPFNICLNYLYGILYGQIEASLLMAGLDPYMGIVHINRHTKPALAFDHIEPFRPWADKVAIQLCMHHFADSGNFEKSETEGNILSTAGKKILINTWFQLMEQRSYLQGKRVKNKDHLHQLSSRLVAILKKFELP